MYAIETVPDDAPDTLEQLGTKYKFWYRDVFGRRCMFKEGRPGTGENWAEKVCCELCTLLGIPHGYYELAVWKDHKGVVTPSFVPEGGRLVFGNELLASFVEGYEGERRVRARNHTLTRVMAVMVGGGTIIDMPQGFAPPSEIQGVAGVFLGYLMLDALVGNQDRHDENWGLVLLPDGRVTLAPTFDHASSLGRNERDEERMERLTTNDQGRSVERYVERARSALYGRVGEKPLTTLEAFAEAAKLPEVREAKGYWLAWLAGVRIADFRLILDNIPPTEISDPAKAFALRMLEINRERLLRC
jgi:hypothetical protein